MTKHQLVQTPLTVRAEQVFVAPENPRSSETVDIQRVNELADSIEEVGILSPLIGYEKDGDFYATAGGRRALAITRLLLDERMMPDAQIPIILMTYDEAITAGHTEQMSHIGMSDLDELRVYLHPAYTDLADGELARRLGKSRKAVQQRRLVSQLPQRVIDSVMSGEIKVEQAFGLTYFLDDETMLDEMHDRCIHSPHIDLEDLRQEMLRTRMEWSRCGLTQLVSQDEYIAAGGKLQQDLFADDAIILTMPVLQKLAVVKAAEQVREKYPNAAFVLDMTDTSYADVRYHRGVCLLTEEEQEEWDEMDPSWQHERSKEPEWFARYDELKAKEAAYPDDLLSMLGVGFRLQQYRDPYTVIEHILPEDLEPLYQKGYLERPVPKGEAEDGLSEDIPVDDSPSLSTTLRAEISLIKLHAAKQEMAKNIDVIFTAYLTHLATGRGYGGAFDHMPQNTTPTEPVTTSSAFDKLEALYDSDVEWIAAAKPADRRNLLAAKILRCATVSLTTVDYTDCIRTYWSPSAEFFKRYKKAGMLEMIEESTSLDRADFETSKASAIAERLVKYAAVNSDWLPTGF